MDYTRAQQIVNKLKLTYPLAKCELNFDCPFHLLVAVILSAQCTDKRVNVVTAQLFKTFSTVEDFAGADPLVLQRLIFSCGFYRTKAASIISASQDILIKFGGQVPNQLDQLISLKGVGRKTANVMLSVAFGTDAIAVDTHVFRLSHRLGLSSGKTPYEVEMDLASQLGQFKAEAHHLLIFHGRYCCKAKVPACDNCPVIEFCKEKFIIQEDTI